MTLFAAQAGVAPGQACVAYDGDRVLGGGWISRPSETAPGTAPATGQSELDSH